MWGIVGAVIATAFAHGLQFLFHFIYAKRIREGSLPFRLSQFVPGILFVFAVSGFYWITKEQIMIRWVVAMMLGIFEGSKIIKRKSIF